MNMLRLCLAIASGLFVSPVLAPPSCAPKIQNPPRVRFEFEVKLDANDTPHSRVFVRANGRRTLVLSATEGFQTLARADYASRKVPKTALAACTGWWAGAGDNLYVVRRGAWLDVFQQEMDEQAAPSAFRKIKSIRLAPRAR